MKIQCDTREHKKELERIQHQFDRLGVDYFNAKLSVGDYMSDLRPGVSIDRKKESEVFATLDFFLYVCQ